MYWYSRTFGVNIRAASSPTVVAGLPTNQAKSNIDLYLACDGIDLLDPRVDGQGVNG
jgi:hypothetical protein